MEKKYNCLSGELKTLAQFVFIYEKQIKHFSDNRTFQNQFPSAFWLFNKKIKKHICYAKSDDIIKSVSKNKYGKDKDGITLAFTKYKVQIIDLCRQIRNSVCHAMIKKKKGLLYIEDKQRGKSTSYGYLEYPIVIEFVVEIIRAYK